MEGQLFLNFKEVGSPNDKKCISIRTAHFDAELGVIYYYVPFKQYVFQCRKGVTLLSNQLLEISNFITNLDKK